MLLNHIPSARDGDKHPLVSKKPSLITKKRFVLNFQGADSKAIY
jgi:hypothetical protein